MNVYDYYPKVLEVINEVGQGRTVTDACDRVGIEVVTFRSYVDREPTIKALFVDAEQRSYDAMADALINIDNHKIHGQSDAKMAKVISDNIKWVLAKRRPKDFGERIEIKHEHTVDIAITSRLNAARQRLGGFGHVEVIEAEVVEDDEAVILASLFADVPRS